MENSERIVLYDSPGSPCACRVRITLIEKGLPYEAVRIDLTRMEQKSPEFLRLNPNGVVPALTHGDRTLHESNVITEYLDDVFPDRPLYPDGADERAQVKHWQSFELSFAKDFRPLMYQRLLGPVVRLTRPSLEEALAVVRRSTDNPLELAWEEKVWSLAVLSPDEERDCAERLYERIDVLERALARREWLVGERFSQAEISVYPRARMYGHVRLPIEPARFPAVARWMARLEKRPSFERSLFPEETAIARLAHTPILPWLAARLRRDAAALSLAERAGLALARRVLRRAMRGDGATASGAARAPRALAERRRPGRGSAAGPFAGTVAPAGAPRRFPPPRRPDEPLVLYDAARSPSCRRVRILLRELALPFTVVPIDLARMEQKTARFAAEVNPNGEVPVLRDGARRICDSTAIMEYLDGAFGTPERHFVPDDAFGRAQMRMWIAYDQGLHKEWRPLFFQLALADPGMAGAPGRPPVEPDLVAGERGFLERARAGTLMTPRAVQLARAELLRRLDRLELELERRSFLVGEAPTLADFAWASRVECMPLLGVDVAPSRFPALTAWRERLEARPSFRAEAHASPAGESPLAEALGRR